MEGISISDQKTGLKTTGRRLSSHPHADQIKLNHVADRVGMKLIWGQAILGADRSVKRKNWRNQSGRKMLWEPSLVVRRRTLGTVIRRRNTDNITHHTRAKKRKKNRNFRRSGLRRAICISSGFLPKSQGRGRFIRRFRTRGRRFLPLGCFRDLRRGS